MSWCHGVVLIMYKANCVFLQPAAAHAARWAVFRLCTRSHQSRQIPGKQVETCTVCMHWLAAFPVAAAAGEQRWCTNAGAKMAVVSCHAVMLHLPWQSIFRRLRYSPCIFPPTHLNVIVHLPIDTSYCDSPSSRRHCISPIMQPTSHREWQSIFSVHPLQVRLTHPDDTQHLFIPAFCSPFLFSLPRVVRLR